MKTIHVIIALIGLIILFYLLKPRSEFEVCYDTCLGCNASIFDKFYKQIFGKYPQRVYDERLYDTCEYSNYNCIKACSGVRNSFGN